MSQNHKPKRPVTKVLQNFYQALKINRNLDQPIWEIGESNTLHECESSLIRIGIWNVFKGNGAEEFFRDYQHFISSTDICLLQEVLGTQHGLQDYVPLHWRGVHGGTYERRDGLREGVLTMSHYELEEVSRILAPHLEPIVKTPKGALAITLKMEGVKVRFLNLHMPLFRSVKRFRTDLNHILQVVKDHEGPLVVAGDFNTVNLQYLRALDDILNEMNLFQVNIPMDPRRNLNKLDHIYIRGLRVKRVKLLHKLQSSDHLPIICELILKKARSPQ